MYVALVVSATSSRCKESRSGLSGAFQLDELETSEHNRRLCTLTVPVIVQAETWFVVHAAPGRLPARGRLRPSDELRKRAWEEAHGKRRNQSRSATKACIGALRDALGSTAKVLLQTDQKRTYPGIIRQVFARDVAHQSVNSHVRRDRKNLLLTVNNTFAQARDAMSRLDRRNWVHSKLECRLGWQLWA